jgi:hypothetical protein
MTQIGGPQFGRDLAALTIAAYTGQQDIGEIAKTAAVGVKATIFTSQELAQVRAIIGDVPRRVDWSVVRPMYGISPWEPKPEPRQMLFYGIVPSRPTQPPVQIKYGIGPILPPWNPTIRILDLLIVQGKQRLESIFRQTMETLKNAMQDYRIDSWEMMQINTLMSAYKQLESLVNDLIQLRDMLQPRFMLGKMKV